MEESPAYGGQFYVLEVTTPILYGAWYEVVFSFGPEGARLYLNDKLIDLERNATLGLHLNDRPLVVGASSYLGTPTDSFIGLMDNLAVAGSQLLPEQMRALVDCAYTAGCDTSIVPTSSPTTTLAPLPPSSEGLIAYWRFDEAAFNVAIDSMNVQNGTYKFLPRLGSIVCSLSI